MLTENIYIGKKKVQTPWTNLSIYWVPAAAAAKSLQLCPTLGDPIDGSPPGSPIPGILQARTLEWVAISFSNAWKWKVKVKSLSCVLLFVTPWTAAYLVPPSVGFSRQECWSGVPSPSLFWVPTVSQILYKTCTYITIHQAKQAPKEGTLCCWVIHSVFAGLVAQRGFHSWEGSDLDWLRHRESRTRKPAVTLLLTWKVLELEWWHRIRRKEEKKNEILRMNPSDLIISLGLRVDDWMN